MEQITDMIGLVSQAIDHATEEVLDKLLEINGMLCEAMFTRSRTLKREELLKAHNLVAVVVRDYPTSDQLMLVEISGKLLNYVMELTEKIKIEGDQEEDVPVNGIFQTKRLLSKAMVLLAGDDQRDKLVRVNAQLGEAMKVDTLSEKKKVLSGVNAKLSEMLMCLANSKLLEVVMPINQSLVANMKMVSKEIKAVDKASRITVAESSDDSEQTPKETQPVVPNELPMEMDPPQVEGMLPVSEKSGKVAAVVGRSEIPVATYVKIAHLREGLQDAIEPVQNPLKIDLILEHVFGFLSVRDLKACRQVSKFWYERSLPAWRSTVTVELYPGRSGGTLAKFLKFVGHRNYLASGKPYTKFSLNGRGTNLRLWGMCGSNISILHLSQVTFQNVDDFRNVIFHHCSNMKELKLVHIRLTRSVDLVEEPDTLVTSKFKPNSNLKSFATNVDSRGFGISWMEVLSHFPALQVLTLDELGYPETSFSSLFRSATAIRARDSKKLALKELHDFSRSLDHSIYEEDFDIFRNFMLYSNLKLENVTLRDGICFNAEEIWDVVSAHASTLQKVRLTFGGPCVGFAPSYLSILPNRVYENLEVLELECHTYAPLGLLNFTPNLKKLVFACESCDRCIKPPKVQVLSDVLLENCTELEIQNSKCMPEEQFQNLAICLSRVKKLKVCGAHNEQFAMICANWPELTDLTIGWSRVGECGITGMDMDTVERVNKGLEPPEDMVPLPNITNLKALRHFSLACPECSYYPKAMGRCAVIYGFQQLSQLEFLKISGYKLSPYELWDPLLEGKFPSWK